MSKPLIKKSLRDRRTPSKRSADAMVRNSALYKEFLAQREAILHHRWAKSQESGKEVGFETALFDWILHHRRAWKSDRQSGEGGQ